MQQQDERSPYAHIFRFADGTSTRRSPSLDTCDIQMPHKIHKKTIHRSKLTGNLGAITKNDEWPKK